jgi:two-component system, chemotaxis family, protein-glutamate methylesterase/glutaminase
MSHEYELNRPVALSCPECGGSLDHRKLDTLSQYVCHIGHVFSSDAMSHAHSRLLESTLSTCFSLMNERIEMCRQLEEDAIAHGESPEPFARARQQARDAADVLRNLLTEGWNAPEHFRLRQVSSR